MRIIPRNELSEMGMIEKLEEKMRREGLSIYFVSKELGTDWKTVKAWLQRKRKPQAMSQKVIRQFVEG